MSSWVAGRRSSSAPAHRAPAARDPGLGAADDLVDRLGELVDRALGAVARCARPSRRVACTVRSTASRTASGSSLGLVGRRAIRAAVSHSAPAIVPAWPLEHRSADPPEPAADLAERVLLPGDPHRALAVAQALLERPQMFNHAAGSGATPAPRPTASR